MYCRPPVVRIERTRGRTSGDASVLLVLSGVFSAMLLAAVAGAAAGTLDASFGSGGKVTTDFNGRSNDGGVAVVLQGGKIVVAGDSTGGGSRDFALASYLGR